MNLICDRNMIYIIVLLLHTVRITILLSSFDQSDSFTSQLLVVQLVDGSLETFARPELDHALASSIAMRVAERDFAHFTHKVLQILPRNIRREILDDEPVLGAKRRRTTITRR